MSATLRLDTLKFAKRLAEAGLPREAAEAIVEGLNEADLSELAAKSDIVEVKTMISDLRAATESEIGELRAATKSDVGDLRAAISDLRADIYGRLWVMGVGIVGLTVALIKLLPG